MVEARTGGKSTFCDSGSCPAIGRRGQGADAVLVAGILSITNAWPPAGVGAGALTHLHIDHPPRAAKVQVVQRDAQLAAITPGADVTGDGVAVTQGSISATRVATRNARLQPHASGVFRQ